MTDHQSGRECTKKKISLSKEYLKSDAIDQRLYNHERKLDKNPNKRIITNEVKKSDLITIVLMKEDLIESDDA